MSAKETAQAFRDLADRAGMCPAAALLDPQDDEAPLPGSASESATASGLNGAPDATPTRSGACTSTDDQAWALPRRQLWECVCAGPSVGGQSLLECLLRASWQTGAYHALVDTASGLDPETLHDGLGEHLLWVPVRGPEQVVRVLDLLLRDDNFAFIAADLRGLSPAEVHRIQPFAWYRLQRLAHQRAGGALILSDAPQIRCADRRILLNQTRTLDDLDQSRDTLLDRLEATTRSYARGQVPREETALAS
ncbi:MAG: hypothetical protein GVY36_13355 [Verrucomicrobia bacterium]|nr:hypothetical protein [Verrucomicrobiota bacterium]